MTPICGGCYGEVVATPATRLRLYASLNDEVTDRKRAMESSRLDRICDVDERPTDRAEQIANNRAGVHVMQKSDASRPPHTYGPEYGPEAVRRLRAGHSISYSENGMHVREDPDGRRFEIRVEEDGSATFLREL